MGENPRSPIKGAFAVTDPGASPEPKIDILGRQYFLHDYSDVRITSTTLDPVNEIIITPDTPAHSILHICSFGFCQHDVTAYLHYNGVSQWGYESAGLIVIPLPPNSYFSFDEPIRTVAAGFDLRVSLRETPAYDSPIFAGALMRVTVMTRAMLP